MIDKQAKVDYCRRTGAVAQKFLIEHSCSQISAIIIVGVVVSGAIMMENLNWLSHDGAMECCCCLLLPRKTNLWIFSDMVIE